MTTSLVPAQPMDSAQPSDSAQDDRRAKLAHVLQRCDERLLSSVERTAALERFFALRTGREKPNRFWRVDLETFDPSVLNIATSAASPRFAGAARAGVLTCDLVTARREHAELLERAFGASDCKRPTKFGSLATAFVNTGAFVHLAANVSLDEPIVVTYDAGAEALFSYTILVVESGARGTVVERVNSNDTASFACGITEIVTGAGSDVSYAFTQDGGEAARTFSTRTALPGRDSRIALGQADLCGQISVADLIVNVTEPGATVEVTSVFFPARHEHVDVVSTVAHDVGDSTSNTLVKTAGTGNGQARYLGNIRIAPDAQRTQASLRDDALLLSRHAHVDSVPALEIGANDVRAYHGATVGAIDEELLFYMTSRGIEREHARTMIALGFFEPAIERFPTEELRSSLRRSLESKVR